MKDQLAMATVQQTTKPFIPAPGHERFIALPGWSLMQSPLLRIDPENIYTTIFYVVIEHKTINVTIKYILLEI